MCVLRLRQNHCCACIRCASVQAAKPGELMAVGLCWQRGISNLNRIWQVCFFGIINSTISGSGLSSLGPRTSWPHGSEGCCGFPSLVKVDHSNVKVGTSSDSHMVPLPVSQEFAHTDTCTQFPRIAISRFERCSLSASEVQYLVQSEGAHGSAVATSYCMCWCQQGEVMGMHQENQVFRMGNRLNDPHHDLAGYR